MNTRPALLSLILATRNAHKTGEIRAILGDCFRYLTLNDFPGAPAVQEDAPTFAGNATKKAVELARWLYSSRPSILDPRPTFVLADDSGLEVDALNGAPGVHSARFAALSGGGDSLSRNTPDADNNAKLLRLLEDVPEQKRTGRFRCVLALVEVTSNAQSQAPRLVEGICEGRIAFAPRGFNGFGYDPLFVPDGFDQTFAELGADIKNRLSHRARALQQLKEILSQKLEQPST